MALVAERVKLLDTENAFKIGPHIRQLEAQGKRVIGSTRTRSTSTSSSTGASTPASSPARGWPSGRSS